MNNVDYVKAYIYMNWCIHLKSLSTIASNDAYCNQMVASRQNSVNSAPA
jgi:hypothetical protein